MYSVHYNCAGSVCIQYIPSTYVHPKVDLKVLAVTTLCFKLYVQDDSRETNGLSYTTAIYIIVVNVVM